MSNSVSRYNTEGLIRSDISPNAEILEGIKGFQSFLMYGGFHLADAVAAAKSAYFAAKIKTGDNTPVERYSGIISGQINNTEYNYLNRLQKINKEAFYYCTKHFGY